MRESHRTAEPCCKWLCARLPPDIPWKLRQPQFVIRGWRYGGHREGALQFLDDPDTLSLAAFDLHEHGRFANVYDFTAWWLHDVSLERRTHAPWSAGLPRCIAGAGR